MAAYEQGVLDAVLANEADKARDLAGKLHKSITPLIKAAIEARGDEARLRKTISQIGGQRIFDDLRDMLVVLERRAALKAIAERIVGPIKQLDETRRASSPARSGRMQGAMPS